MAEAEVTQGIKYVTMNDLEHLLEMDENTWIIAVDMEGAKSYKMQISQIIDSVTDGELDLDGGSFL